MPHSWVRVSYRTSHKIRDCQAGDTSRAKFEECVKALIEARGGQLESIHYESNGKWARVEFRWNDPAQRDMIIHDLEGDDPVDLLTLVEAEELELRIAEADATQSE
jgi:hypothetical protein